MNDEIEQSMEEKMWELQSLTWKVCKRVEAGEFLLSEEMADLVYGYVDGLSQKWLLDRVTGRCSPAVFMAFDMEAEEKQMDEQINVLKWVMENGRDPWKEEK